MYRYYVFADLPEPFDDDAYRTKEEVEKFIRDILQNDDYRLLHRAPILVGSRRSNEPDFFVELAT